MRKPRAIGPGAAELAARFRSRRCFLCGGVAEIVSVGCEFEGSADVNACLEHAATRLPYRSEVLAPRKTRSAHG